MQNIGSHNSTFIALTAGRSSLVDRTLNSEVAGQNLSGPP